MIIILQKAWTCSSSLDWRKDLQALAQEKNAQIGAGMNEQHPEIHDVVSGNRNNTLW